MTVLSIMEWVGAGLGLAGATLIALNVRASGYGWLLFLASNIAWIAYGVRVEAHGLVAMQLGFSVTSLVGIRRWLFSDRVPRRFLFIR
jgi:hypothetical protein